MLTCFSTRTGLYKNCNSHFSSIPWWMDDGEQDEQKCCLDEEVRKSKAGYSPVYGEFYEEEQPVWLGICSSFTAESSKNQLLGACMTPVLASFWISASYFRSSLIQSHILSHFFPLRFKYIRVLLLFASNFWFPVSVHATLLYISGPNTLDRCMGSTAMFSCVGWGSFWAHASKIYPE